MNLPAVIKPSFFWITMIILSVIVAIYGTVFSLTHGIYEVFPFLYFLPIILFVNFYPNRGVIFSLAISTIFLILVYFFSNFNTTLIAVSTAWFVIFVMIGFVTSSFAEGTRAEQRIYREIFENSLAGIFTFALTTQRIQEINGKCAHMLGYNREDLIDKDLSRILLNAADRETFISQIQKNSGIADTELLLHTRDGLVRQFLVSASLSPGNKVICSAVDITERKLAERVIQKARGDLERKVKERSEELMRANDGLKAEILERKRFEATLKLANRKLNTLSSITNHDILVEISAIDRSVSLAEEMVTSSSLLEHLKNIEKNTHMIKKQIRFARNYQNIGLIPPQWQVVDVVIRHEIAELGLPSVRIEKDLDKIEIFADLLLEKVFHNILDNVVRHGKKDPHIQFSFEETGEGLTISCQDDGEGIPSGAKESIFKCDYFRNKGYGLFLASEILSMTGLSICETGEPGSGARIEIRVPSGSYRFI